MMYENNSSSTFRLSAWKWACMVILVYVFIAGWLVPLKPGIIKVTPDRAEAGEMLVVDVTGYNSSYLSDTTQLRAWLKLTGDTVIKAQHIQVWDNRSLSASFYVPSVFPIRQEAYPLTLVIDHGIEGASVLPNAIFITPATEQDTAELKLWFQDKIQEVHQKAGIQYPFRNILAETIRNTYFHVPMWFCHDHPFWRKCLVQPSVLSQRRY